MVWAGVASVIILSISIAYSIYYAVSTGADHWSMRAALLPSANPMASAFGFILSGVFVIFFVREAIDGNEICAIGFGVLVVLVWTIFMYIG